MMLRRCLSLAKALPNRAPVACSYRSSRCVAKPRFFHASTRQLAANPKKPKPNPVRVDFLEQSKLTNDEDGIAINEVLDQQFNSLLTLLEQVPENEDEWADQMEELAIRLEAQHEELAREAAEIEASPEWIEYRRVSDEVIERIHNEFMESPEPVTARSVAALHKRIDVAVTQMQEHYSKMRIARVTAEEEEAKRLTESAEGNDQAELESAQKKLEASSERRCGLCGTTKTVQWRKWHPLHFEEGQYVELCNACGQRKLRERKKLREAAKVLKQHYKDGKHQPNETVEISGIEDLLKQVEEEKKKHK